METKRTCHVFIYLEHPAGFASVVIFLDSRNMSFAACKAVSHQWNVNKLSLYTVECFVHADYVLHF